jgi:hypothetical protein
VVWTGRILNERHSHYGPRCAFPAQRDLSALKIRQQGAWSSGDYAIVGTTLQIVGETLCEAVDLRAEQRGLSEPATVMPRWRRRRRWCDVVSTVYVPALLERCRERAAAERLAIEFRQADAEALPFAEASFDSMSMLAGRRAVVHHATPKGDFS